MTLPQEWNEPPRSFGVTPFWFWNDDLTEAAIVRQIADFEAHGVYGFVIHPRVGLPRRLGWMSPALLRFYRIAVEEAARRNMAVILYDEGMYPSGSSSGQVVAANPAWQTRCLDRLEMQGDRIDLPDGSNLAAIVTRRNGRRVAVFDRKVDAVVRGLHYVGRGPAEDLPPAADILNPQAVAQFIRLVYDGFAAWLAPHFGRTIGAMFTDEPSVLARCRERGVWPGTTGILTHVQRILGYDFTPHLPALWYDDEPDAVRYRADYLRAVKERLEETYYAPLRDWCQAHGLLLTGHPDKADNLGAQRYLHIPGQDLVWRWVLPDDPTATQGRESTAAKCSSSAMVHLGRRRNANELYGAYGHGLTWDEMAWLANWCFVRGVNWLLPHAFYYSRRGPRRDERPPDVGPHAPWWAEYRGYADACRRLSFINSDGRHVCSVAILGRSDWLPWASAEICFEHQRDFNYIEERHLWQEARVDGEGVHIGGMHYAALIVEGRYDARAQPALDVLARHGRLIRCQPETTAADLVGRLDALAPAGVNVAPAAPALRVRHVVKDGLHCFLLFNEEAGPLKVRIALPVSGPAIEFDVWRGRERPVDMNEPLTFAGHQMRVIVA